MFPFPKTRQLTTRFLLPFPHQAPRGAGAASPDDVHAALCRVPGVLCTHDVHHWQLKPGLALVSAHVTHDGAHASGAILADCTAALARLGLDHATIQVASADDESACAAAREGAGGGAGAEEEGSK